MTSTPPSALPGTPPAASTARLLITVHGIRTYGKWQEALGDLAVRTIPNLHVYHYKYGFFSMLAFLFPPFRWFVTRAFRRQLELLACRSWSRVDIAAHSFGSAIVLRALRALPRACSIQVHTAMLAGSALPPSYDSGALTSPPVRVTRIVNDCGTRDGVLLLAQAFVLGAGAAGRLGLAGLTGRTLVNRFYPYGHSDYFRISRGRLSPFLRTQWLPLLLGDDEVGRVDHRPRLTLLQSLWTFLVQNARPLKLGLYITPVVLLVLYFHGLQETGRRHADLAAARQVRTDALQAVEMAESGRSRQAIPILCRALDGLDALENPDEDLRTDIVYAASRALTGNTIAAVDRVSREPLLRIIPCTSPTGFVLLPRTGQGAFAQAHPLKVTPLSAFGIGEPIEEAHLFGWPTHVGFVSTERNLFVPTEDSATPRVFRGVGHDSVFRNRKQPPFLDTKRGLLCMPGQDGVLRFFNWASGALTYESPVHEDGIVAADLLDDSGHVLALTGGGRLLSVNPENVGALRSTPICGGQRDLMIMRALWLPASKGFFAVLPNSCVYVSSEGECTPVLPETAGLLLLSGDSETCVLRTSSGVTYALRDVPDGRRWIISSRGEEPLCVDFTGRRVASLVQGGRGVEVFDHSGGRPVARCTVEDEIVAGVFESWDDLLLCTQSGLLYRLGLLPTLPTRTFHFPALHDLRLLHITPDGSRALAVSGEQIRPLGNTLLEARADGSFESRPWNVPAGSAPTKSAQWLVGTAQAVVLRLELEDGSKVLECLLPDGTLAPFKDEEPFRYLEDLITYDGDLICVDRVGTVSRIGLGSGRPVWKVKPYGAEKATLSGVVEGPGGTVFVLSYAGRVFEIAADGGRVLRALDLADLRADGLYRCGDRLIAVGGSSGGFQLVAVDVRAWKEVGRMLLPGVSRSVTPTLAVSSRGDIAAYLAVSAELMLVRADAWGVVNKYGTGETISDVAFSSDGSRVMVELGSGEALVLRARDGRQVMRIAPVSADRQRSGFALNGRVFYVLDSAGRLCVYSLVEADYVRKVRELATDMERAAGG